MFMLNFKIQLGLILVQFYGGDQSTERYNFTLQKFRFVHLLYVAHYYCHHVNGEEHLFSVFFCNLKGNLKSNLLIDKIFPGK